MFTDLQARAILRDLAVVAHCDEGKWKAFSDRDDGRNDPPLMRCHGHRIIYIYNCVPVLL